MTAHRPLVGIVVAFSIGILLQKYVSVPFLILLGVEIFILFLGFLLLERKRFFNFVVFFSCLFLGLIASAHYQSLSWNHFSFLANHFHKKPVVIEGIVSSDAQQRYFFKSIKTTFEFDVKKIKTPWGWQERTGKILVNIFRDTDVSYGDSVRLEGKIHRPFNFTEEDTKFSYRDYLAIRQIHFILSVKKEGLVKVLGKNKGNSILQASLRFKNYLKAIFDTYLSKTEANLLTALILGDRYDISPQIRELFVRTGTAHILAISGFNVGIVAFLAMLFFKMVRMTRRVQYCATIVILIFYAFLTGMKAPVVRATIMAVVFIMSLLTERETDAINTLCLAAFIILLSNPMYLFDVGFELSFISVLGIILIYARVKEKIVKRWACFKKKPLSFITDVLLVSLAAWIAVLGLVAYYFHILTPVTIAANIIVIPLMSAAIAVGLGLLFMAGLPSLAGIFAVCLKAILNLTVGCIYLFSQIPGAYYYFPSVSCYLPLGYYLFVACGLFFPVLHGLTKQFKYGKVDAMRKIFFFIFFVFFLFVSESSAFWMWTPETNRWINPKFDVKETPELQLAFAKGFFDSKDYKKAVFELEKLIRNYPKAREAAEAQFLIGQALEAQGKPYEAYKAYQKMVEKYPFSERFAQVVEKQYQVGERMLNGEGKQGKFVSTVIGAEYDIIDIFRHVIKNAPYGKYAAPSQYKIGLYLSEKGLFQESRDEFEKVINDYPESEWVKAAKYQIALVDAKRSTDASYDQKVTKTAVEEFKEFVKVYPDAELSKEAQNQVNTLREKEAENQFLIGRFYEKQKSFESAKIYYQTVIEGYQGSLWSAKALERLRELEIKKK